MDDNTMPEWIKESLNDLAKIFEEKSYYTELILDLFKISVNQPDWPQRYYNLRMDTLPGLVGNKNSSFLMQYFRNGNSQGWEFDNRILEEFLETGHFLFCNFIYNAESYFNGNSTEILQFGIHVIGNDEENKKNQYLLSFMIREGTFFQVKLSLENIEYLQRALKELLDEKYNE